MKNSKRCILNADFEILLSSTIDRCGSAAAAARIANHTSWRRLGPLPWTSVSKALVPCRQFSGNFVIRAPVSSVHYVMLQFPLLVHAWNMCVPTIQAKWRTFPMTISYHSSLMQTQPFLFYQLVDVYHAVAAFGLSNIVTNCVTLCFFFLLPCILCIRPLVSLP